jgi:hypothetical protein
MPIIRVLKAFVFSRLPAGEKLAHERHFTVGEHEVDEEMLEHPWIRDHHADGRIESPKQTALRLEQHAANLKLAAESAALASAEAAAAFARLTAAAPGAKATAEEIAAQLNTPGNLLRGSGGTAVKPVTPIDDAAKKAADEAAAKQAEDDAAKAADEAAAKKSADDAAAKQTLKLKTGTK